MVIPKHRTLEFRVLDVLWRQGACSIRQIEEGLPERDRLVRVSVPYSRGDLVARAHAAGEVTRTEHGPDGTFIEARVPPDLAAELRRFVIA